MWELEVEKVAVRLSLAAVLTVAGASAWANSSDALERAAKINLHATQSVMMDVTLAGDRLVAVGEQGIVVLSDDHGKSWQQVNVPVSVSLTNVDFPSADNGWAVGHGGVILYSGDQGESWTLQLDGRRAAEIELAAAQSENDGSDNAQRRLRNAQFLVSDGPDKPFLDVHFVDALHGWVIGAYGLIFATVDGGKSWQSLVGSTENRGGLHLNSIEQREKDLFIVGEQGLMLRSHDGGKSFDALESPYHGSFFGQGWTSAGAHVVYGLRGNAFQRIGDGDWNSLDMGQEVSLTADLELSDGSLLLADETGRLLTSLDGKSLPIASQGYVSALVQTADGALVVAGMRGVTRIEPKNLLLRGKP